MSRTMAIVPLLVSAIIPSAFALTVPSLQVPSCPQKGTITYNKSDPNETAFPLTQVDVCYSDALIEFTFTAYNETNFYYNASQTTNDPIYEYEVMEAFIYHGTEAPQTYFEFEVNPNNITYQAFVYNPSKLRSPGAPFDDILVNEPFTDGISTTTKLHRDKELWISHAYIPLAFFNVNNGEGKGTKWRMNFFRTVTSPKMFPDQLLGAWNPTNESNFHETPFFGKVDFV